MMDMSTEIISDLELEHIINSLRGCGLDDVGGKEWVEQERFESLTVLFSKQPIPHMFSL